MTVLLQGVVGSTAYGLATADSDVDRLGIWRAPRRTILGFGLGPKDETRNGPTGDWIEHEVAKFCRLALKANPTVTEMLWLPEYEVMTPEGSLLCGARESFLGSDAIMAAYSGYAFNQADRLIDKQRFPDVPVSRIEKHGRHCARLLHQALGLLTDGTLAIHLGDAVESVREAGVLAATDPQRFAMLIADLDGKVVAAHGTTSLPPMADAALVEQVLVAVRSME